MGRARLCMRGILRGTGVLALVFLDALDGPCRDLDGRGVRCSGLVASSGLIVTTKARVAETAEMLRELHCCGLIRVSSPDGPKTVTRYRVSTQESFLWSRCLFEIPSLRLSASFVFWSAKFVPVFMRGKITSVLARRRRVENGGQSSLQCAVYCRSNTGSESSVLEENAELLAGEPARTVHVA